MPNAANVTEVSTALDLDKIIDREWYVQAACAKTGDGLYEGLAWLSPMIEKMKK